MADPPTLERLAAELGTGPFALLRAFRDTYGMPPHTWLTDARVRRARRLLDAGTAPSEAAVAVGFTDQPHLNRHFGRIVGVPPGAYQRERKNVQDARSGTPVPSGAWQWNGQKRSQTYGTTEEESRTVPSYGTPSVSGSPSDSQGSPSA
jgi:AraC-like DNA-binding protein